MNWYRRMYLSESAKQHAKRTISRLNRGKFIPGYLSDYAVRTPEHLLEIIGSGYLAQKSLRERCPLVWGMTRDKQEALELVRQILAETYEHRGDFQVKEYLRDR